jgi:hypothetical protein
MGTRYYDPINGRLISPDPLGHDASMSLYDYYNGDPVNAWVGGANPESVWTRIEKPALMLNKNVHRIIIRDSMKP